jgi:hypothetical protein
MLTNGYFGSTNGYFGSTNDCFTFTNGISMLTNDIFMFTNCIIFSIKYCLIFRIEPLSFRIISYWHKGQELWRKIDGYFCLWGPGRKVGPLLIKKMPS